MGNSISVYSVSADRYGTGLRHVGPVRDLCVSLVPARGNRVPNRATVFPLVVPITFCLGVPRKAVASDMNESAR